MVGEVGRRFPGATLSWLAGGTHVLATLTGPRRPLPPGGGEASAWTGDRERSLLILDAASLDTIRVIDLDPDEHAISLTVDDRTDVVCWVGVRRDRTWVIRAAHPSTGEVQVLASGLAPASTRGLPVLTAVAGSLCWAESGDDEHWRTSVVDLITGECRAVADHAPGEWARKCYGLADGRVLHIVQEVAEHRNRIDLTDVDGSHTVLPGGELLALWHDRFAVVTPAGKIPTVGRTMRRTVGTGWIADGAALGVAQELITRFEVHRIRYDQLGRLCAMTMDALERGSEDGWGRWRWEQLASPGRPFTTVGEMTVVADYADDQPVLRAFA
ncbi:MAG: hypothetical protein U0Q21_01080 [Dermatophilaceae bacterium]